MIGTLHLRVYMSEWMHTCVFLAFMCLPTISAIQICCSMCKAAPCAMCTSSFVIYICESQCKLSEQLITPFASIQVKPGTAKKQQSAAGTERHSALENSTHLKAQNMGVRERTYLAWHWFTGCNVSLLHTKHRAQAGVEIRGGETILYFLSPWELAHPIRTRNKEVSVNTCFSIFPLPFCTVVISRKKWACILIQFL